MERVSNQQLAGAPLSKRFTNALEQFATLLRTDDLDGEVSTRPEIVKGFEQALSFALESAFGNGPSDSSAHLFLQRVLYRINRLKFFWYDELDNYKNERSEFLRRVRQRIESRWEPWELRQLASDGLNLKDVSAALRDRAAKDVAPPLSPDSVYFRDEMGVAGYRRLLEIASLDGLVEASQLSRTLGGVANDIHAMMTRLLVEEYGGGRLSRKHSSFFTHMLEELDIDATPEGHFDVVPWEVLASVNHSFLLSERKRYYLRYVGGLLYTEISVPAAFDNYRQAAERLGMSEKARGYWDLHIKEDERHGRWMLNDVALPLAVRYSHNAAEIVLGYDQQKFMSSRAGQATAEAVRAVDRRDLTVRAHHQASYEAAA